MTKENSSLRLFNPPALSKPVGYSHVAEVGEGKLVFISGQVPLDSEGNLVGSGDFAAQAEQVFENLKIALEAAGGNFHSVIKFGFFTRDISNLTVVREIRDRYINKEAPPASTAVEVSSLYREDILLEVDAVALVVN
jgi:reactive intermediate/imine deaminase